MIVKYEPDSDFLTQQEWDNDWQMRVNPELMTELSRRAVPALAATQWEIIATKFGYTETVLPLNRETTNQHGTHQAALIALSADYTGGMALTTLLTGVPLTGIHPNQPEISASLWLAGLNMRYMKPSTGHLLGICKVPKKQIEKIRPRYQQGRRCLIKLTTEFISNGEMVATGEGTYFVQPTRTLTESKDGKLSTLASQKLKASARMISGVRASIAKHGDRSLRFDEPEDCLDAAAAGPHGMLLAETMSTTLPQLSQFVKSRTESIDELIANSGDIKQLVLLGAGLDMRPFRLANSISGARVFELDLPEMLVERKRVIEESIADAGARISIAADFTKDDIGAKLTEAGFDKNAKSIVIYEGCSMYFDEAVNRSIFKSIGTLLAHPDSLIWCDFVDQQIVEGSSNNAAIDAFLQSMAELGEKFIFGVDDARRWLDSTGLKFAHAETAWRRAKSLSADMAVLKCYQFCVAGPKN